ncbi:methylated-DNA--protein-cysteine methyltransferase isoform X4 [Opisthocomus hoazin]|uniref:methylated-DNA--protein-cysteine methyltransferase isoform X4 n=1 Tax=Opisthocomus hoazin TaxID=30419 RepID=UPI003F532BE0
MPAAVPARALTSASVPCEPCPPSLMPRVTSSLVVTGRCFQQWWSWCWGCKSVVGINCGKLSSTMASRLVRKVNSKEGEPPCKERRAILLSPVGKIEISGCEKGLHEIKLPKTSVLPSSRAESSAACEVCEGAEEMTEPLTQCAAWLRAYFCQPARMTSLPVPAFHHPLLQRESFTSQVLWTLLRDVKFGEAVSYKQLAALAGNSRAARAVGGAMRSNPMAIVIPCHRVICSSGQTGNYGAGSPMKEWLLSHEKLQKEKSA